MSIAALLSHSLTAAGLCSCGWQRNCCNTAGVLRLLHLLLLWSACFITVQGRELSCACTTAECIASGRDICRAPRHCYSRLKEFSKGTEPLEKGCALDAGLEIRCSRLLGAAAASAPDSDGTFLVCCSRSWCNSNTPERLPMLTAEPARPTPASFPSVRNRQYRPQPITSMPTAATFLTTQATGMTTTAAAQIPPHEAASLSLSLLHTSAASVLSADSAPNRWSPRQQPGSRSRTYLDITVAAPALAACMTLLAVAAAILVLLLVMRQRRHRHLVGRHRRCRLDKAALPCPPSPRQLGQQEQPQPQYDLHYRNSLAEQQCSPVPAEREERQQPNWGLGEPALLHQDD